MIGAMQMVHIRKRDVHGLLAVVSDALANALRGQLALAADLLDRTRYL